MARATTNGIDIEEMTLKDLEELQRGIERAIPERKKGELVGLREQLGALAAAAGYTLDEVVSTRAGKKPAAKGGVAVKYRNPENSAETWSGRGRMATWLAEKLKKRGAKREDFAV